MTRRYAASALLASGLILIASPAWAGHGEERDGCDHGATSKPCRPDPQPTNGKDCEAHGNHGGINEDHCSPSPTTTTVTPSPTTTGGTPSSTETAPATAPSATPTATTTPTGTPSPSPTSSTPATSGSPSTTSATLPSGTATSASPPAPTGPSSGPTTHSSGRAAHTTNSDPRSPASPRTSVPSSTDAPPDSLAYTGTDPRMPALGVALVLIGGVLLRVRVIGVKA